MVAPERVLSTGQIEMYDIILCAKNNSCSTKYLGVELFDHLSVCQRITDI